MGAAYLLFKWNLLISLAVYAAYTLYHALTQQIGITKLLGRVNSWEFQGWKFATCAAVLLAYFQYVYMTEYPTVTGQFSLLVTSTYFWIQAGLLALTVLAAFRVHFQCKTSIGKSYLWANELLILTSVIYASTGYIFFFILVPRIVHDLSAFQFYIVHDTNRSAVSKANFGLNFLRLFPFSPAVTLPAASIGITAALYYLNVFSSFPFFFFLIGYVHYYMEGFIWKGDSPHRQYVRIQ